ncbi:MAG: 50S ribosomal protein L17 [Spirochaetaceae bacterium]
MKHKVGYNRLGRKASHRKSLHRNMVTSLFLEERIRTTKAKALAVRRTAEKMITRAKEDTVHNRRIVGKDIKDKAALAKLFTDVGPRFVKRPGGYTRILKLGQRAGDASEMVLLELVQGTEEVQEEKVRRRRRRREKKEQEARELAAEEAAAEEEAAAAEAAAKEEPSAPEAAREEASEQASEASEDDSKE